MGYKGSYICFINKKLAMNKAVQTKILINLTGRSLSRLLNNQGIVVTWVESKKEISISPDLVIKVDIGMFELISVGKANPIFYTNSSLEMLYYLKNALHTKTITQ